MAYTASRLPMSSTSPPSQDVASKTEGHIRSLRLLSWSARLLVWTLITASALLFPLFDASPKLVLGSDSDSSWVQGSSSALLRWDAFHFLHIADKGYTYEHEWAFFPGAPLLMRLSGTLLTKLFGVSSPAARVLAMLQGGALCAALLDSTRVLYALTLHHFGSPSFAYVSALLSLVGGSPAALRYAPYTEPFFAYLSYRGMLCCARERWVLASVCFAGAGTLRSNGVLLCGFVGWGMVGEPVLSGRVRELKPSRIVYATLLTSLPLAPFIWHSRVAHALFCAPASPSRAPAEWCARTVPSVYGYVQDRYWGVGFMRYWTLANAPNFVIALPALGPVVAFCVWYLRGLTKTLLRASPSTFASHRLAVRAFFNSRPSHPFLRASLLPHVLHALILSLTLVFAAHTQIALRVLPTVPLAHWALAWALMHLPQRWGRVLFGWSACWALVACVLWALFLPPA